MGWVPRLHPPVGCRECREPVTPPVRESAALGFRRFPCLIAQGTPTRLGSGISIVSACPGVGPGGPPRRVCAWSFHDIDSASARDLRPPWRTPSLGTVASGRLAVTDPASSSSFVPTGYALHYNTGRGHANECLGRGWCNEEHAAHPGSNTGVQVARPRIPPGGSIEGLSVGYRTQVAVRSLSVRHRRSDDTAHR